LAGRECRGGWIFGGRGRDRERSGRVARLAGLRREIDAPLWIRGLLLRRSVRGRRREGRRGVGNLWLGGLAGEVGVGRVAEGWGLVAALLVGIRTWERVRGKKEVRRA